MGGSSLQLERYIKTKGWVLPWYPFIKKNNYLSFKKAFIP